ncbi:hypothetical protein ACF0H5_004063 [Mactra antiquata]
MPKDGDKKKRQYGRKKRIQLDDDDGVSYYRQFVSTTLADSSTKQSAATKNANPSKKTMTGESSTSTEVPSTSSNDATNAATAAEWSDERTKVDHSSNKADESSSPQERSGASSPDPNCAICLGKLENKSFTDSCFHQFCFDCLVEWSKVKAECPLCKQPFKSIVHNVRSYKDYDQYHIPRPEEQYHIPRPERVSVAEHLFGDTGVRFRFRTTVTDHRYAHVVDRINREIESRLLQRPSRSSPVPNYRRLRQPANSDFRRRVYEEHLQLNLHEQNTRRRVRETSPTFFRNNPAQTHRLVPWLNRELNALLPGGEQVAFILDLIVDLIKRYPIDSEEFYQHVLPYTGRHTRQFVREFMTFAKSAYHMAAYDRHCTYEPSADRNHDSESDNDDNDGLHNARTDLSTRDMDLGSYGPYPSAARQLTDMLRPQALYGLPGSSFLPSTRDMNPESLFFNPALNSDSVIFTCPAIGTLPPQPGTSSSGAPVTQTEPIVCDETDSESSSTDIEIVEVEKPWHERSPIQLSSNDDCDSDIMITGTTYLTDPVKKEKKKKKKKDRRDNLGDERRSEKRKRDDSVERYDAKRSAMPESADLSSGSRSRSVSPLRLTIIRSPDYQHKKFMYRSQDGGVNPRSSSRREEPSSSTESDSESHVSITSRRHKSKSTRSSIEIVEYRKKRSKSKKNKKNKKSKKYDDTLDDDIHSEGRHHKKGKTHKKSSHKSDRGSSRSGHSSSGSHSKHRNKSKKKKHDKDYSHHSEKHSSKSSSLTLSMCEDRHKNTGNIFTSDSDLDSDIDVETVPQKVTEPSVEGSSIANANVEFVELNPAQAAVIDQELDQINKTLANNDYISSLMSGGDNSTRDIPEHFENNDPNRLVNPDDVLNSKSFKKHPFGHKKSSKSSKKETNLSESRSSSSAKHNLVSSIAQLSRSHTINAEDNIQISDISSCTDTDLDRQLPSFLTFSTRNSDLSNHTSGISNPFYSHGMHDASILSSNLNPQFFTSESMEYESPTSTNLSHFKSTSHVLNENPDIIDVETLSSDSNSDEPTEKLDNRRRLDMFEPSSSTALDLNSEPSMHSLKSYKTSDYSIKVDDIGNETNEQNCNNVQPTRSDLDFNSFKSYKTSSNSLKINTNSLPSYKTNSNYVELKDRTNISDLNDDDDDDIVDVDVVSDDNYDTYDKERMSVSHDSRHDTDVDIENDNSDIECSVIEGHKTFEVDGNTDDNIDNSTDDGEVIIEGDVGAVIDVVGCSDEEVIVEDVRDENESRSDAVVENADQFDSNSKLDHDCDSVDLTTSTDNQAEMSTTQVEDEEKNYNNKSLTDEELDSDSEVNISNCNNASDDCLSNNVDESEGKNEPKNEKCENSNASELNTSNSISSNDVDIPADVSESDTFPANQSEETKGSETLQSVSYTSASASSTVFTDTTVTNASRSQSTLSWTSQSMLEARQHSLSGSSDSVYQGWQSEELEQHESSLSSPSSPSIMYGDTPPNLSPSSPVYSSSPEWWNHPNFQAED